jgi:hypothetical protein
MSIKEIDFPFPKFKPFKLNEKQMSEFEKESAIIDKQIEEARKILERQLPHLSEKTSEIRFRLPGRYK